MSSNNVVEKPILFANRIVEADWDILHARAFLTPFITAISNAPAALIDYPNLQGYLMDLYQQPGIARRSTWITSSGITT